MCTAWSVIIGVLFLCITWSISIGVLYMCIMWSISQYQSIIYVYHVANLSVSEYYVCVSVDQLKLIAFNSTY